MPDEKKRNFNLPGNRLVVLAFGKTEPVCGFHKSMTVAHTRDAVGNHDIMLKRGREAESGSADGLGKVAWSVESSDWKEVYLRCSSWKRHKAQLCFAVIH